MNETLSSTEKQVPCAKKKRSPWITWLILCLSIIFYGVFTKIPIDGLDSIASKALAYAIIIVIFLLFEIFPVAVTSVIAVVIPAPLGIISQADVFSNFAIGPVFFVFGVFILAIAFTKTGFGYRVSLYVSGLLGNKPSMVLLSYMLAAGLLSSVLADIPTAVIFGVLALEILKDNGCMPGCSNFGRSMMIGIPVAATVGGLGTPAGGALNVLTISILKNLTGIDITFIQWTIVCFPFAAVMLLICWLIISKVFPAEIDEVKGLDKLVEKRQKLGPMTIREKKYLAIFALMFILWITQNFHGMALWTVAVLGVSLFFLPGIDILSWKETRKEIDYEVPFLIGGTNVVAAALTTTGAANWIAENTIGGISSGSVLLVLLVTAIVGVYGRYIIPSNTAMVAVLTPVVCLMSAQFNLSPTVMAFIICFGAHVTTLLPFSDPVSLATYDHGYWTLGDMLKPSVIYGTLWIPISVAYLYAFSAMGLI